MEARAINAQGSGTYELTGAVVAVAADVPANATTTSTVSVTAQNATPTPTTSSIEAVGDVDWHRVVFTAGDVGDIFRIDLTAASGSPLNPNIAGIYKSDGALIPFTSNDNTATSTNSQVFFRPEEAGTYFIAASSSALSSTLGAYNLSVVNTGLSDAVSNDRATSGVIVNATNVSGNIDIAGDIDWYRVTLLANVNYRIGVDVAAPSTLDPVLAGVYNAQSVVLANTSDDDSGIGSNALRTVFVGTTGTYYIAVAGHGTETGNYTLSLNVNETVDDIGESTSSNRAITISSNSGTANGVIERIGDHDWFAITTVANNSYTVTVTGQSTSALVDPEIDGLYNASGVLIAGTADSNSGSGTDPLTSYFAGTAGTIYVSVSAAGTLTGGYSVNVTQTS
ncbi:MAG: hypothetical protein AAF352_06050, partial [Pseudomonadota bacterium]